MFFNFGLVAQKDHFPVLLLSGSWVSLLEGELELLKSTILLWHLALIEDDQSDSEGDQTYGNLIPHMKLIDNNSIYLRLIIVKLPLISRKIKNRAKWPKKEQT